MTTTQERNAAVLAVLNAATEPLGPTEIARRVDQPWCWYCDSRGPVSPSSAAITPVLRRIEAVRHEGGRYTKPDAKHRIMCSVETK